jgi:hypothetical protein
VAGFVLSCVLAVLAAPDGAVAGLAVPERARLATTGNHSELRAKVPISTKPFAAERIAMSLAPDELPQLRAADTLRISAEVQVSTTCAYEHPKCIGRHYRFNPKVTSRVLFSSGPDLLSPSVQVGETREVRCTQRRPDRNHHCVLTIPNFDVAFDPVASICPDGACYVNLAVGAWHRKAGPRNKIVLGGDRPDGSVVGDKGRLNVVRFSALTPVSSSFNDVLANDSLPVTEPEETRRRVIHSVEIQNAKAGEVLAFDASYVADIDHLPYNVFLQTQLIVADSPTATEPQGTAKQASILAGYGSEGNGVNCTQGRSGFRSPCTLAKAGAIRFDNDAVDAAGSPVPVYLNLVAWAEGRLVASPKPGDRVSLRPAGGLPVARRRPAGSSRRSGRRPSSPSLPWRVPVRMVTTHRPRRPMDRAAARDSPPPDALSRSGSRSGGSARGRSSARSAVSSACFTLRRGSSRRWTGRSTRSVPVASAKTSTSSGT